MRPAMLLISTSAAPGPSGRRPLARFGWMLMALVVGGLMVVSLALAIVAGFVLGGLLLLGMIVGRAIARSRPSGESAGRRRPGGRFSTSRAGFDTDSADADRPPARVIDVKARPVEGD